MNGKSQKSLRPLALLKQLGPGLVTGAADDDPSGIATYSQAGAQSGYGLLWTLVLTYPLMVSIQLVSAEIGRVTGCGLAKNMCKAFPRPVVVTLVYLLFIANTVNVGADLAAMGAVAQLSLGGDQHFYTVGLAAFCCLVQMFVSYERYARFLKWLTLVLLAYVGVFFSVKLNWGDIARALVMPTLQWSSAATTIVAVFGTTISPYMFFWQSAQEVEEVNASDRAQPLVKAPAQARHAFSRINLDTLFGMAISNIIGLAIMISTAATLHLHGKSDIGSAVDAAKALEPIAGPLAFALFSLGIIGTGLLAVPVLAGSAAYAVGETYGWKCGLNYKPWEAVGFYAIIAAATALGLGIDFIKIDPMKALYWAAVVNGVISAPIMAALMILGRNQRQMGKFVIRPWLAVLGWISTAAMAAAMVAMFALNS